MKCKKCEQTFEGKMKYAQLRSHYTLGHPGYMRRIGSQLHQSNIEVELAERAAWGVAPGIPINLGKYYAKRPITDEDNYVPRQRVYADQVEKFMRRRELDSAA